MVTSLICGNRFVKAVIGILSKLLLMFRDSEAETVDVLKKYELNKTGSAVQ
jgi:hypothetical protein